MNDVIWIISCIFLGFLIRIIGEYLIKKYVKKDTNEFIILHRRNSSSFVPHIFVKEENPKLKLVNENDLYQLESIVEKFSLALHLYRNSINVPDVSMEDILNNSFIIVQIIYKNGKERKDISMVYKEDENILPFHFDINTNKDALIHILRIYADASIYKNSLIIPFSNVFYIHK